MKRPSLPVLPILSVAALVGCAADTGFQGECESGQCETLASNSARDVKWATCAMEEDTEATDEFFRRDKLICTWTDNADLPLIPNFVSIRVKTKEGGFEEATLRAPAEGEQSQPVVVAIANGPAYPLQVEAHVDLTGRPDTALDYRSLHGAYDAKYEIASAQAAAIELFQPFDLLAMSISVDDSVRALFGAEMTYALDFSDSGYQFTPRSLGNEAAPLEDLSQVAVALTSTFIRKGETATWYIPAPRGLGDTPFQFSGSANFGQDLGDLTFSAQAPGNYLASSTGLQPSSPSEDAPAPMTKRQAYQLIGAAICERELSCEEITAEDLAPCIEGVVASCTEGCDEEAPKANEDYQACADAFAALACSESETPSACVGVL